MGKEIVELNAVISSVRIGFERECFLTGDVHMERADGFHQGFGGYVLGGIPSAKAGRHDEQKNLAAMWLVGIMQAAGVDDYNKAVGKAVRIRVGSGFGGKIESIGHIIKDDRWFSPADAFGESQP